MKTKIIATIGPKSSSFSILKKMKEAGMDIARINTKYASIAECKRLQKLLRKLKCKVLIDMLDENLIEELKTIPFDYLAVAFTESAEQLKRIRKKFAPRKVKLIAKIESKKGVKNLDEIINESDGVMIARGDLGENVKLEKLPIFQKEIIRKCNEKRKFDITATEMLLSMVKSRTPTRAEVSDVANAVFDGSDALMLSEETAIGNFPVEAVRMMRKIANEAERARFC